MLQLAVHKHRSGASKEGPNKTNGCNDSDGAQLAHPTLQALIAAFPLQQLTRFQGPNVNYNIPNNHNSPNNPPLLRQDPRNSDSSIDALSPPRNMAKEKGEEINKQEQRGNRIQEKGADNVVNPDGLSLPRSRSRPCNSPPPTATATTTTTTTTTTTGTTPTHLRMEEAWHLRGNDFNAVSSRLATPGKPETVQLASAVTFGAPLGAACCRFGREFGPLLKRAWLVYIRTPMLMLAKFVHHVALALICGSVFWQLSHAQEGVQNRLGAIYFMLICAMFAAALATCLTFADERAVFLREQREGMYAVMPYFLAKSLVEVPFLLAGSTVYALLLYFLLGFQQELPRILRFVWVHCLVALCGQGLGLVVATMVSSVSAGALYAPLSIAPFILFTPYALPRALEPAYFTWLKILSPFNWAFEALMFTEFQDLPLYCDPDQLVVISHGGAESSAAGLTSVCRFADGNTVQNF